ncbi:MULTISPECIES: molybdopterin-dependent oxidoreductase [unclassified Chelatococcus]|uniref:molybdopterin-dependent oxidoreductase n=1 Tax=unclassified Chelatococcus TaxID=2638111 RepID=UPI001BCC8B70|nr:MULTISPECIES: molybdopterin-dependent oxidoreductase [unclassified Chelatococcus]MBS7700135.1 molybdopterin-dependent oxidoreductase [Chelatococcus sp. YT9]MBX3556828.1 molybdopterin-dependent oxidoreductase [Chelatococcus sp.]
MKGSTAISLCHWGAFEAEVTGGCLVSARPWANGLADPDMIGALPALVHSPLRIDRPHVREGFLRHRHAAGGSGRGVDRMVPVDWDTALDIVSSEVARIRDLYGPASILGGSYGWSSAGRLHHARSLVRRFLAAAGGFTDQLGNYSWGAANAILPYVLGTPDAVAFAATEWRTIAEETEVLVAFGGLNAKNWRVTSGGAGQHHMARYVDAAARRGTKFVIVSPLREDIPPGIDALHIAPRPNTDTALILALAHRAFVEKRADLPFLERYAVGHGELAAYLRGDTDGIEKTFAWAAGIAGITTAELETLWGLLRRGRVMLTASWSLQRADHGEQPFWALIALAAILGQIGLPGGGFCFGYGSMNGVGAAARRGYIPTQDGLENPARSAVPVATLVDALSRPGETIDFNGRRITFPDIRMVYWAGGNPFHHAQDLFALEQAWQRPETIVVHEPWWTPTARRADIVLPATTTVERNDLGGSSRDPFVFAMPKLIDPLAEARDDFMIFGELAERLGCGEAFSEGLDEFGWLRRLWQKTEARGRRETVSVPDFDTFWADGFFAVPAPERPEVLLEEFRSDPISSPLPTPSGRIELYSERIEAFGYQDCPAHPAWLEPHEWLGNAEPDQLHLVTNQPAKRLHSQLFQVQSDGDLEPIAIHPADARRRGISDGDRVRVENGRGTCLARAELTGSVREGVAVMATGAWFAPAETEPRLECNGNPNAVTANRRTSALGQACAALSTLVRLRRFDDDRDRSPAVE